MNKYTIGWIVLTLLYSPCALFFPIMGSWWGILYVILGLFSLTMAFISTLEPIPDKVNRQPEEVWNFENETPKPYSWSKVDKKV